MPESGVAARSRETQMVSAQFWRPRPLGRVRGRGGGVPLPLRPGGLRCPVLRAFGFFFGLRGLAAQVDVVGPASRLHVCTLLGIRGKLSRRSPLCGGIGVASERPPGGGA